MIKNTFKVILILVILIIVFSYTRPIQGISYISDSASVIEMEYDSEKEYYLITPDTFNQMNGWVIDDSTYAFNNTVLKSTKNQGTASTTINIKEPGRYKIWIRTLDYPNNNPGTRNFTIKVNDNNVEGNFGKHGEGKGEGASSSAQVFLWEKTSVNINQDTAKIEVNSNAPYARFDAIIITNDGEFEPSNVVIDKNDSEQKTAYDYNPVINVKHEENIEALYKELIKICGKLETGKALGEDIPDYIKQSGTVPIDNQTSIASISNSNIEINFKRSKSSDNKNYVQQETKIKKYGIPVTTQEYNDGLAWLCLYSEIDEQIDEENIESYSNLENISTPNFKYKYNRRRIYYKKFVSSRL
ncbi:MAG: hypothetical protein IKF52_00895 [Clostridia bacterium]|nr:hypothetical protein [Clostridia bacterium]